MVRTQTAQYLRVILIGAVPIMLFDILGSITLLSGAAKHLRLASSVLFILDIAGDLTERYRMIDPSDPAHNIGLKMIFASADDVSYNSSMNLNNVCIRINR